MNATMTWPAAPLPWWVPLIRKRRTPLDIDRYRRLLILRAHAARRRAFGPYKQV